MSLRELMRDIRACTHCAPNLPLGPRPVLQVGYAARILIAGQAPGRRVHETGLPFNDPSGDRLRKWLGVTRDEFYDPTKFSIIPMGFCFPGTGRSGDLPPRPECAELWRDRLLSRLKNIEMTIVLGQYAQRYHLPGSPKKIADAAAQWRRTWPHLVMAPHPSPRNQLWLRSNPWFERDVVPKLRNRIRMLLAPAGCSTPSSPAHRGSR